MGVSTLVALPEQVGLSHLCRLEIGVFAVPRAHVACGVPSHRWADVGRRWEKYGQEHHLHVRLQFASRAVEAVLEVSKLNKVGLSNAIYGVDRSHL